MLLAGEAHELDGGLLATALGKLEREFKRLLDEQSCSIHLPDQMAPREGESPTSSSELDYLVPYSPEVLQRLQVIITKLAGNAHYNRCIDAYQDARGALCDEGLQVSYIFEWYFKVLGIRRSSLLGNISTVISVIGQI